MKANYCPCRNRSRLLLTVIFISFVFGVCSSSAAPPQYSITDLGSFGGTFNFAYGVNNSAQIVGASSTPAFTLRAFLYQGTNMIDLNAGDGSQANSINDQGQIVGYFPATGGVHAFLYTNGVLTDLGTLGGVRSFGNCINNNGEVAGTAWTPSGTNHAFKFSGGPLTDLGTLGGVSSAANGINNNGDVAGLSLTSNNIATHAFLFTAGVMKDLGTLGGTNSSAAGVNDAGQVVGTSSTISEANHAFFFANGVMSDLGTLGGNASQAHAINNYGDIVGQAYPTGSSSYSAFIYTGQNMIDLNALIPTGTGWQLQSAQAINDRGQIAGFGQGPSGGFRAFLLTPLTPPEIRNFQILNGKAQFELHGTTGLTYRIDYTPTLSLTNWSPLTNILLPSSIYQILDPDPLDSESRFYRAVQLQ